MSSNKIAFVFPGQGAQYIGMGKEFYDNYASAREVFEIADSVSPMPMKELIFAENEQLNTTKYTQVAMLCVELAILKVVTEAGLSGAVMAGLSLGEYAAIVGCGAMTYTDALKLIVKRGQLMQEAVPTGGAMTAVIGMENEQVQNICARTHGIVSVANYNCPGQIVITGEKNAVDSAAAAIKEAGAKRCIPLKVSGPFHSILMQEAGETLYQELENVQLGSLAQPYVTNVNGTYVTETANIKDLLKRQIFSPVHWQQSVETMIEQGVDVFIEIGPGKTLTGFLKKINQDITGYKIENRKDLENVLSIFH